MTDKDSEKLDLFKKDISDDADDSQHNRELANEDMRYAHISGATWEDYGNESSNV